MTIPELQDDGLLPSGVHDCTLEDIRARFAWNEHRKGLFDSFLAFVSSELRPSFPDPIYFDGSFVTDKELPDDTDVVLDLIAASDARKWRGLQFLHQHQARLMQFYRVHFWVNLPGANDFTAFFQYVGLKTARLKGLHPSSSQRNSASLLMGVWTEAVERKAAIIHSQLAMARSLASQNNASPDVIAEPYLDLLRSLYAEEYAFAQLTDSSDLVARFTGPAVDVHDPTVSVVISVFSDIRGQIRSIAKSVVGLATDRVVRWPGHLDPHLAGLAHGSLIVGVSVSPPSSEVARTQLELEGVSEQVLESVRSAVRSLSVVARYITESSVQSSIQEAFPDPAVRDTVLLAAKRLAPTGRRGIDAVSFFSPTQEESGTRALTPRTRTVIAAALHTPVQETRDGSFDGVVREIDLDARRFEIRGVASVGAIRCSYEPEHDSLVRKTLDAKVRVSGSYESLANGRPRLLAVKNLSILALPPTQLQIPKDEN